MCSLTVALRKICISQLAVVGVACSVVSRNKVRGGAKNRLLWSRAASSRPPGPKLRGNFLTMMMVSRGTEISPRPTCALEVLSYQDNARELKETRETIGFNGEPPIRRDLD